MTIAGPDLVDVATDTPCRRCQYNLRGMRRDGRCPECGTLVALSMGSDLLRYADASWVSTLRVGVETLFWAVMGWVVAVVIGGMVARPFLRSFAGTLVGIAYGLAVLTGQWLATTPDPGGRGESAYGGWRRLVRVTVGLGVVRQVNGFALRTVAMPPIVALPLEILGQAFSVTSLVGYLAMLQYFRRLARRIPDFDLADRAGRLRFGLCIPLGLFDVYSIMMFVMTHTGGGRRIAPWVPLLMFVGLFLFAFGVSYLRLLRGLAKRLGAESDLARRTWAEAERPIVLGQ